MLQEKWIQEKLSLESGKFLKQSHPYVLIVESTRLETTEYKSN